MKYIKIYEDGDFVFRNSEYNAVEEDAILISDEVYEKYFLLQSTKKFKIKDITGTIFDEIFEEVIPEIKVPEPQKPNVQEMINSKMTKDIAMLEGKLAEQQKFNSEMATKLAVLESKNTTNIEKEGV